MEQGRAPIVSFVSLGCPKALVDSERIITRLRAEGYELARKHDGADLVMEVVSDDPKDRARDYQQKLADYAEAKVAEYWIVDPERKVVLVHRLQGERYAAPGEYSLGDQAKSVVLSGFEVDVTKLFDEITDIPD